MNVVNMLHLALDSDLLGCVMTSVLRNFTYFVVVLNV